MHEVPAGVHVTALDGAAAVQVRARVCKGCLVNSVIKLSILSTEHDALLSKASFTDVASSVAQLPVEALRCLSGVADIGDVSAVHVNQVMDSPSLAEKPAV